MTLLWLRAQRDDESKLHKTYRSHQTNIEIMTAGLLRRKDQVAQEQGARASKAGNVQPVRGFGNDLEI